MNAAKANSTDLGEIHQLRIEDGIVVGRVRSNIAQPDCATVDAGTYEAVADRLGRCRYEGGALSDYTPPAVPEPVPSSISDRQFAQVLALDGVITEGEALAWAARGDLPKRLLDALDHIPEADGQRFGARMMLSAATAYERRHPLVPTLGALLDMDTDALDSVWVRGAAL